MASQLAPSSSSRRRTGDRSVGMFTVEEDIGKGSFATVYRGKHKVRHRYPAQAGTVPSYPDDSFPDGLLSLP